MNNALKSLENNALAALTQRAPSGIVSAIKTASAKTGVNFSYLMEKAAAESNFNPTVKAKTSSATGLFQFIDSTWMDMMKRHGEKYGIDTNQDRQTLLNLRKDPSIASLMAAEFAGDNAAHLEKKIGGDIGNTELYFAHFMGAGGASAFLSQLKKNPMGIAADIFPREASANRGVFYDRQSGAPKTLQQVYNFFDKKFTDGDAIASTASPETMAHKPSVKKSSYAITPVSENRYSRIDNTMLAARNSLFQIQNQIDDYRQNSFFAQASDAFSLSLYSNTKSPSSILLDVLK